MPGELRVLDLDRQYVTNPVPDIFWRDAQTTRQQAAELAIFANRLRQASPEPIHVRTTLGCRYEINVGLRDRLRAFGQPPDRPIDLFAITGHAAAEELRRKHLDITKLLDEILLKPTLVLPFEFLPGLFNLKANLETRTQDGLGAQ